MAADKGAIDVGATLRDLRRRADLSQRELAEQSGIPKSTLARIEAGQGAGPAFRTVERLVRAAGGELVLKLPDAPCSAAVDESPQAPDHELWDELRDEAGRRYPAHLDVRRVLTLKDWPGAWWVHSYTLPQRLWPVRVPELTYDLDRARRDKRRLRDQARPGFAFGARSKGCQPRRGAFSPSCPGPGRSVS
ncbi:helix-turn-helix domain-containing protein [Micromonospora zamorensis]|uniref:helix-turn-helix domain-containing protein n=1 Tax=Micromonospora zamorensis TaxID=709883 RepID=UPI0033B8E3CC